MSVQYSVHKALADAAEGATGPTPVDTAAIAEQVGTSKNQVSKILFNLAHTKKISLEHASSSRRVTGYRLLVPPGEPRKSSAKRTIPRQRLAQPVTLMPGQSSLPDSPAPSRRRTLPTPLIDAYAANKDKFERLTRELGDMVAAEFKSNPYAEEGLLLRQRLDAIEGGYTELQAQVTMQERDLRALRKIVNDQQASKLADTVVVSGE